MSKKQQPLQAPPIVTSGYESALAQANQKSPLQTKLEDMASSTLDWASKGDYRDRPKNIFFDYYTPAMKKRQRELEFNAGGQGIFALGQANPTQLALAKQNLNDEEAERDAAQYEQDVKQGVSQAGATAGDLAQLDQARRMGILGQTAGLYGTALGRPKQPSFWDRLLGGAQTAASTAAMFV
jgi:hypothetical protein